ncbi:MAG TPA: hypothetical protein VFY60_02600 [Pyrinomonadaceae bacterium]|nr:hypothetical protein [Pyrinomonadaceae bacterium]
MFAGLKIRKVLALTLAFAALLITSACAAFQPVDPNGPRSNAPQYPIALADVGGTRLEEASLAWYQLSERYGVSGKTEANLHPYTGTLESLPANLPTSIHLPKVGDPAKPTEEDTRESLRRFIVEWQRLIGAEPDELSLVERTDEPTGVKVARYEQRPFRYPLRGGFGNLIIRFRSDGQIVGLSSNCIPNADRLQTALGNVTPKVTREQAVDQVRNQRNLAATAVAEPQQLVVYAQPAKAAEGAPQGASPGGLEMRLAWEINVTNGSATKVYVDAVSNEIIATS